MTHLMTLQKFNLLSPEAKKTYILEQAELEDFWLIGKVKHPFEANGFFFITELINPYTGRPLPQLFKNAYRPHSVYCPVGGNEKLYDDGTLVAAKISLSDIAYEILRGNIFQTTFYDLYAIETSDEIFELIGMDKTELPIVALAKPLLYDDGNSRFVDLAAEIIKPKIAKDLDELHAKSEELALELENIEKAKEQLKAAEEKLRTREQALTKLGFQIEHEAVATLEKDEKTFLPEPETTQDFLKAIQAQLSARGYQYEESTLRQLLIALKTGQMIILSGPSGTGKTTIVKQLADIMHANYEIIPVQPSWTDKQDLLGFYNPIRKLYVPSAFLDCLVEARENEDQLYFICLDEMNLAQIEYYLADLLSIRELEDGKIRLYSDFEWMQNMKEIQWYIQQQLPSETADIEEALENIDIHTSKHFDIVMRFENLKRFPAQFTIPENVRIIGTMNVDGAVQALSPKVIDRSFVIPLERQEPEQVDMPAQIGRYDVKAEEFIVDANRRTEIPDELSDALSDIQHELKEWQIEYNRRYKKHALLYYQAAEDFDLSTEQLVDDLTLMKLLPRIHDMVEDDHAITRLIKRIELHCKSETLSTTKLENMKTRFGQTGLYSYWS